MQKHVQTGFLYATPTFFSGAASALDFWGVFTKYNTSTTPQEADAAAIALDWRIVGQDIAQAMKSAGAER